MKITKVEGILVRSPSAINAAIADGSQDGLIVRVHTDAGIVGIGEISPSPSVAKAVIDAPPSHKIASGLASLLVGEDPFDVGRLWRKMYEGTVYFGRRGVVLHAMSGIEIALWDIVGKAVGKPIHALVGGARRKKVKAYASTLMPDSPDEVARKAATQREAGFDAIKFGWGPLGQSAELDVALVAAARKGGGDDFDLMIDVGFGFPALAPPSIACAAWRNTGRSGLKSRSSRTTTANMRRSQRRSTRRLPVARRRPRLPISSG